LGEALANRGDRRHFVRVRVAADGRVCSAGRQTSHALSSLAAADGLVDLAPGEMHPAGTTVPVLDWA
jgi:molybdopterin biosynthesis enzyme